MTDCEALIWSRIRRKQLLGVQFYRQKPIGSYIVDFYAPSVKLVVELDGSQHFDPKSLDYDARRDAFLGSQGLSVLRFNNMQVLKETRGVLETIYAYIEGAGKIPPAPLFQRGGIKGN
ncbi:MAG: endonuclease domain-containing protein [Myxococcota bacterium]